MTIILPPPIVGASLSATSSSMSSCYQQLWYHHKMSPNSFQNCDDGVNYPLGNTQPCIVIVTVEISLSIAIAITVIIKSCYHQSNLRRQQKKWAVITSYHWVNYRPMCGQTEQAETVVNSQSTSCNSRQLTTVEFLQQKSSTEQTKSETVPALLGPNQIVSPSHCYIGFCSLQ